MTNSQTQTTGRSITDHDQLASELLNLARDLNAGNTTAIAARLLELSDMCDDRADVEARIA